jgi:urease accessory protein
MSVASSRSELPVPDPMAAIRAVAGVSASFGAAEGVTRLASLTEFGGYRGKLPASDGNGIEAVLVNTGGGVAGGDHVSINIAAEAGASVTVTTPSAERIYRSTASGQPADINVRLAVESGATLVWAPQATLLFNGARLTRSYEVDVAPDGGLLMAETTLFGRRGSGETMTDGLLRDHWRVRRGGELIFADATRLAGPIGAHLARPAVADNAGGVGLLLAVAPGIEEQLDAVRAALATVKGALVGVSAWDGLLVMRCTGTALEDLQDCLRRAMQVLNFRPLPVVWQSQFMPLPGTANLTAHAGSAR